VFRPSYSKGWKLRWKQPAAATPLQLPSRDGSHATAQHDGHAEDARRQWSQDGPPESHSAAAGLHEPTKHVPAAEQR
jgi:hypothetical protein